MLKYGNQEYKDTVTLLYGDFAAKAPLQAPALWSFWVVKGPEVSLKRIQNGKDPLNLLGPKMDALCGTKCGKEERRTPTYKP